MLKPEEFFKLLRSNDIGFYAGVPDSLLKNICACITDHAPQGSHIISANEGAAVALGVGYHLATGKVPLIYMQNSGLGNAINPLMSIVDKDVFSIPMLLLVGWRGEPGVPDEPQHKKQGRVLLEMLESMEIPHTVVSPEINDARPVLERAITHLAESGGPYAIVVKKGTFETYVLSGNGKERFTLLRETAIKVVLEELDEKDAIISTTGKTSRELYELRETNGDGHERDFLNIGGMGHASQIALGVALNRKDKNVYCLDGDGAVLMHMGSLAINATTACTNFTHILINNGSHESVGGQPTVGHDIDFQTIAEGFGYRKVLKATSADEVKSKMVEIRNSEGPAFLEICVKVGSRANLGRPSTTPIENKKMFMEFLR